MRSNTKWARSRFARWGTVAVAAALTLATASACTSTSTSTSNKGASASPSSSGALTGYPRSQTIYTSGTMYTPPSNWNPFNVGNYHGRLGARLRAAVPVRPDEEQLHPVVGVERDVDR